MILISYIFAWAKCHGYCKWVKYVEDKKHIAWIYIIEFDFQIWEFDSTCRTGIVFAAFKKTYTLLDEPIHTFVTMVNLHVIRWIYYSNTLHPQYKNNIHSKPLFFLHRKNEWWFCVYTIYNCMPLFGQFIFSTIDRPCVWNYFRTLCEHSVDFF